MTLLTNAYSRWKAAGPMRLPLVASTTPGALALGSMDQANRGAGAAMGAYGQVGTLFAIVNRIAEAVAGVDWSLYQQDANGDRTLIDDATPPARHPFTALWSQPNPFYSRQEFIQTSHQHLELTGEAWWLKVRQSKNGPPVELWPIRPDRMMPVPDRDQFIRGYIYQLGAEKIPLQTDDIIFLRVPSPTDPYRGMGPVQAMMADIEGEKFAGEYNRNFFRNSANPGGIVESPDTLSDVDFDRFVNRWRETHQGVNNAHRVALLEGGLKWVDAKYTFRDMQFEALRKFNRDQFLLAFGMSGTIVGVSENINRANAMAGEVTFARWLLKPRLERIKHAINARLVPEFGDNLTADYANPVPMDTAQAITEAVYLWTSGLVKRNDALEWAGQPALEDTDPAGEEYFSAPAKPPRPPMAPQPSEESVGDAITKAWPPIAHEQATEMEAAWQKRLEGMRNSVIDYIERSA